MTDLDPARPIRRPRQSSCWRTLLEADLRADGRDVDEEATLFDDLARVRGPGESDKNEPLASIRRTLNTTAPRTLATILRTAYADALAEMGEVVAAHDGRPRPYSDRELLRIAAELARIARAGLGPGADPLEDEVSLHKLLEDWHGYDRGRPFRPWAKTVLYRATVSRLRKRSAERDEREVVRRAEIERHNRAGTGDRSPEETLEAIRPVFIRVRDVSSTIGPPPAKSDGVDYRIVFLFETRLRLANVLQETFPEPIVVAEGRSWGAMLDELWPWSDSELSRTFRPGWATAGAVWSRIAWERLVRGPEPVIEACLASGPPTANLTAFTWSKWIERAKPGVREQLGPATWDRELSVLFPDRRPGSTSSVVECSA